MTSRDDSIGGGPSVWPPNLQEISAGGGIDVGIGDDQRWWHFDNSVNAVSFGFVATAILISMFLVMAIFERFLRPRSPFFSGTGNGVGGGPHGRRSSSSAPSAEYAVDVGAQRRKLDSYPSPKMSIYAKGVSVLMPGNDIPTFIAHPAPPPVPCPPERILWPPHHPIPVDGSPMSSD